MKRGEQRPKPPSDQETELAVYGVYPDCSSAGAALKALRAATFGDRDISFLLRSHGSMQAGSPSGGNGPSCVAELATLYPVKLPDLGDILVSRALRTMLHAAGRKGQGRPRLSEALSVLGFPHYQVPVYENAIRENLVLAIVACKNFESAERAVDLLEGTSASEIGALRRP